MKRYVIELCDEYGVDRVGWVLANTVQNHPWDGRFRHYNKTWAQEYPILRSRVPRDNFRREDLRAVRCRPVPVNLHPAHREMSGKPPDCPTACARCNPAANPYRHWHRAARWSYQNLR